MRIRRIDRSTVKVVVTVWVAIFFVEVLSNAIRAINLDEPLTIASLGWQLEDFLMHWTIWIALAPLVMWLRGRISLEGPRRIRAVAAHVGTSILVALGQITIWILVTLWIGTRGQQLLPSFDSVLLVVWANLTENVVIYWALIGVGSALEYSDLNREKELEAARLKARISEERMRALRDQLRPHFFFNVLNAIAGQLRREGTQRSREMIQQLAELFRRTLDYTDLDSIALGQELAFLREYAGLQIQRYGDELKVSFSVDSSVDLQTQVPPLIVQPLLENAIQHGQPDPEHGLRIDIKVHEQAGRLHLEVADSGLSEGEVSYDRPGGRGIQNVRARLRHMYDDEAILVIGHRKPHGTVATIKIPIAPGQLVADPETEPERAVGGAAYASTG